MWSGPHCDQAGHCDYKPISSQRTKGEHILCSVYKVVMDPIAVLYSHHSATAVTLCWDGEDVGESIS